MAKKYHLKRESHGQRSRRRERAKEREQTRAQRSDLRQLALLDERGFAAKRERARLAKRIVENAKKCPNPQHSSSEGSPLPAE
jgi:hypothetical protein